MRHVHWLALATSFTLLSGCAVYPAGPVGGPPPGVVYGAPGQVAVAPVPYPYPYAYPAPYDYGYGPAWYGPPLFISGSIGYVYRSGPAFRPGYGRGYGYGYGYRHAPRGVNPAVAPLRSLPRLH